MKLATVSDRYLPVAPRRRVEAVAGVAVLVDKEFFEIPGDVAYADGVVDQLVALPDLRHRLRAFVL